MRHFEMSVGNPSDTPMQFAGKWNIATYEHILTSDVEVCFGVGWPANAVGRSTPVPARVIAQRPYDHQRAVAVHPSPRHETGDQTHVDAVAEPLLGDVSWTGGSLTVETHAGTFPTSRVARRHDDVRVCWTASSAYEQQCTLSTT